MWLGAENIGVDVWEMRQVKEVFYDPQPGGANQDGAALHPAPVGLFGFRDGENVAGRRAESRPSISKALFDRYLRRYRTVGESLAIPWYFIGAIHNMERFQQRVALARKYLPEFGLAAYCGFGRSPVTALPGILADHMKAAETTA